MSLFDVFGEVFLVVSLDTFYSPQSSPSRVSS